MHIHVSKFKKNVFLKKHLKEVIMLVSFLIKIKYKTFPKYQIEGLFNAVNVNVTGKTEFYAKLS